MSTNLSLSYPPFVCFISMLACWSYPTGIPGGRCLWRQRLRDHWQRGSPAICDGFSNGERKVSVVKQGGPENPKAKRRQTNLSNHWFISLSPLASIFLEGEHCGPIHCKFHFFSSARKHWVTVCNSQASSSIIHVDSVDIHILYFIRPHYIHIIVVTSSSTDVLLLRLPQIISDAGETLSTFSEPRRQQGGCDRGMGRKPRL